MQNRFGKEKGDISVLRDILLPAVLTVTVLVMVGTGVSNVQSAAREQQLASVEEAVRRALGDGVRLVFCDKPPEKKNDAAGFDEIMKEVVKVCKKVEPDCVILM